MAHFTDAQLAAELNGDPTGRGYAPHIASGNDVALAQNINQPDAGMIDRLTITPDIFQTAVVASEYTSLTDQMRSLWQTIVTASVQTGVPIKNTSIRSQIVAIWPQGSTTRTNLAAMQQRMGSRAEVLWGDGTVVQTSDIARALRPPSTR